MNHDEEDDDVNNYKISFNFLAKHNTLLIAYIISSVTVVHDIVSVICRASLLTGYQKQSICAKNTTTFITQSRLGDDAPLVIMKTFGDRTTTGASSGRKNRVNFLTSHNTALYVHMDGYLGVMHLTPHTQTHTAYVIVTISTKTQQNANNNNRTDRKINEQIQIAFSTGVFVSLDMNFSRCSNRFPDSLWCTSSSNRKYGVVLRIICSPAPWVSVYVRVHATGLCEFSPNSSFPVTEQRYFLWT